MVINPIVAVDIPIIRIPYWRWDDHPQDKEFWPWDTCWIKVGWWRGHCDVGSVLVPLKSIWYTRQMDFFSAREIKILEKVPQAVDLHPLTRDRMEAETMMIWKCLKSSPDWWIQMKHVSVQVVQSSFLFTPMIHAIQYRPWKDAFPEKRLGLCDYVSFGICNLLWCGVSF